MKFISTIIALAGIYLIAFTEIQQAESVPKPLEITIHVQPASLKPIVPVIDTSNKDTFVATLNQCVNYIKIEDVKHISEEDMSKIITEIISSSNSIDSNRLIKTIRKNKNNFKNFKE